MRAVVLQGDRSVSVENVPDSGLTSKDSAVVRVERTAICGSDLHLYHGGIGTPGVRLGHEFVGTIVEAGPDVHRSASATGSSSRP
jgi:threonine dehydrogenase-like Zn-dependent dehydrogenase